MTLLSRKTLAAVLAGAFLVVGAATPLLAQEAKSKEPPASASHRQIDPDKAAARLSDTFAIDKDVVLKHYNAGTSLRDLQKAAFLAKASGKSFEDVLALKTSDNTWKDVGKTLAITKEQMRSTHQDIVATQLNQRLGLDKGRTQELLGEGYRAHDIAMASLLANASGKPVADVLQLKKINNTWHQVAQTLGVDDATFKQEAKKLRDAFPRHHFRHSTVEGRR
ncbi:MAG TPA: hypothetical protein PKA10_15795 [Selenomonadales bacterium]|nr:hypothetical protein [Selenomonadales bacterium]